MRTFDPLAAVQKLIHKEMLRSPRGRPTKYNFDRLVAPGDMIEFDVESPEELAVIRGAAHAFARRRKTMVQTMSMLAGTKLRVWIPDAALAPYRP